MAPVSSPSFDFVRLLTLPQFNSTSHPGLVLGHLDTADASAIHCSNDESHAACVRREHTHEAVANAPLILLYFFLLGVLFTAKMMIARSDARAGVVKRSGVGLLGSLRVLLGCEFISSSQVHCALNSYS